ncbi:MAG: Ig-like domain-containing protein [Bacteroidota bacterium]
MGIQPATLQSGLIPATQSTDVNPPVVTISSPAQGASFAAFAPVTITGTVTDTRTVVWCGSISRRRYYLETGIRCL